MFPIAFTYSGCVRGEGAVEPATTLLSKQDLSDKHVPLSYVEGLINLFLSTINT